MHRATTCAANAPCKRRLRRGDGPEAVTATTVRSIVSRDNPLLVALRKLSADPAGYRKQGKIWLEGEHLCAALIERGRQVPQALIAESAWQRPVLRRLCEQAAQVTVVPDALMAGLGSLDSPASIGFLLPWSAESVVQPGLPTVVLDRLQDAGNVGTVLRSAAGFGFAQVVALKGCAALWSPKVLRAGMGAHFALHLVEAVAEASLDDLTVPMLATSPHAAASIAETDLPWPCAWVFGHEGQGVSTGLMNRCRTTLRIPQPGGQESLNVAAAAAVCFYESARQRRGAGNQAGHTG